MTLLKAIDVASNARQELENTNWMTKYRRLVSYIEGHDGSTLVPQRYDQDPELGKWIARQRNKSSSRIQIRILSMHETDVEA